MPGFAPKFTITNSITAALTQIERARGFLEAATLSEEWIRNMGDRALLLEAHHTTHIEGTELTIEQSERLWAGESEPGVRPDDARELLNYRNAFELVSDYLIRNGNPITETLIREIHRRLVEGVRGGEGQPGRYRTIQNQIVNSVTREVIYQPPPPHHVAPMMQDLVVWLGATSEVHPVLTAGIAQFQLVHIHPFVDGNGRTSRLLSTLCLYRTGYGFKRLFTLSEFYDRNRTAFYSSLQAVRRDMDLTVWLEYFVAGLAAQLMEVIGRGRRVLRRDGIVRDFGLNSRQSEAVGYLLDHGRLRTEDLANLLPGVNLRTLQRDLKDLVEKGVLAAEGAARTVGYRLLIDGD